MPAGIFGESSKQHRKVDIRAFERLLTADDNHHLPDRFSFDISIDTWHYLQELRYL